MLPVPLILQDHAVAGPAADHEQPRTPENEMIKRHVIEILYTERCRFLSLAVERVREALAVRDDELDIEVRLILVGSFVEAVARRFRGSPTVRVDGRDVETREGAVAPIGLLARGYVVDAHVERAPSVVAIRRAIDQLVAEERARARRVRAPSPSMLDVLDAQV
jgi:hypothetical protein